MGKQRGLLERYLSHFSHAFHTWNALRKELKRDHDYDVIFIPTVSLHHLLGWWLLMKTVLRDHRARIVLYFLSTPIILDGEGSAQWSNAPTASITAWILTSLRSEMHSEKVVIGVETEALAEALSHVAGIPVRSLPQPVEALPEIFPMPSSDKALRFACYGAARHEKGSDLLQSAIAQYLKEHPETCMQFVIQWVDDFLDESGRKITKSPYLLKDRRVEFITHYFHDGEYQRRLSQTDVIVLPYRLSSYALRGSRVLLEALVNGIPVITTRGTTLAQQAESTGANVLCEDGSVESLVTALGEMEREYEHLKIKASARKASAREHFSVQTFRQLLLASR
jgi:glycosyltransferase involved in cell wall biosynthesis